MPNFELNSQSKFEPSYSTILFHRQGGNSLVQVDLQKVREQNESKRETAAHVAAGKHNDMEILKTENTCPVCHNELEPGDLLLAKYYAGRDWWVVQHLKPAADKSVILAADAEIIGYRNYCGLAGFQITK